MADQCLGYVLVPVEVLAEATLDKPVALSHDRLGIVQLETADGQVSLPSEHDICEALTVLEKIYDTGFAFVRSCDHRPTANVSPYSRPWDAW